MSTLYRPVPIKTAEQAEALPEGSILLTAYGPAGRDHRGDWWVGLSKVHPNLMRDRTALVPVEAEEEFQDIDTYEASGHMRRHHLTRYTTPWEEQS